MVGNLPGSDDKKFWREAQTTQISQPIKERPVCRQFRVEDGFIVCNSCPNEHTVSADLNKFEVVDGKLKRK